LWVLLTVALTAVVIASMHAQERLAQVPPWQAFIVAGGSDKDASEAALAEIASGWRDAYAALIVDVARFLPSPRGPQASEDQSFFEFEDTTGEPGWTGQASRGSDFPTAVRQPPGAEVRRRLTSLLERHTGQRFGDDLRAWRRWYWSLPWTPHPDFFAFKAELYSRIDPRYRVFFRNGIAATIRLDEIDWGGVPPNGIPPLRYPKHEAATDARWLRDNHVVFGVEVNGEARAYPKRILAWHELATDMLGGVDLTIVYCTLCGTVIPYDSTVEGRTLKFGTSGLLYRSNKLMFDEETASLWSSLEGVPVVGPLAGNDLRLSFHSVVTTTWGEWKSQYPKTTVLSIDTGHDRNYGEGAAYRDYFRTDRLMFEVPAIDSRLKNKDEVLVLRREVLGNNAKPMAIAVNRLERDAVFAFEAGGRPLVVITSKGGANRVYERGRYTFSKLDRDGTVLDSSGGQWTAGSDALVSATGERLAAVPAHRAFWFGWVAQHPDTVLLR
jgi:hypothetical protein